MEDKTIYLCMYCRTPMMRSDFTESGKCIECGARKVQVAPKVTDEQMADLVARGYEYDETAWTRGPGRPS
jgi:hypothetical protein